MAAYLKRIDLENFRGIKQGSIEFDQLTLLIGENGSGKSTFMDALALCLGAGGSESGFGFTENDLHHDQHISAVKMVLTFAEEVGSNFTDEKQIEVKTFRHYKLHVKAGPGVNAGILESQWWFSDGERMSYSNNSLNALIQLRRQFPFYLMRGGLVLPTVINEEEKDKTKKPADDLVSIHELENEIEKHYQELVGGNMFITKDKLPETIASALDFLKKGKSHLKGSGLGSGGFLVELIPDYARNSTITAFDKYRDRGSGAQQIAVLLFLGAFLEARKQKIQEGSYPILAIENPEAHLHPLTVAAVMELIDHLNWQKIISTHSGQVASIAPLSSIRRLEKRNGILSVYQAFPDSFRMEDLRRISYHIRSRNGRALFARTWLLVEGETEFWLLPELARLCGYDLDIEGVTCIEYAQSGVPSLLKLANQLDIEWHLLADGDRAGIVYVQLAEKFIRDSNRSDVITLLREKDIEHCFWEYGYSEVFFDHSNFSKRHEKRPIYRDKATTIIRSAIDLHSKPFMALALLEAASQPGSPGVPAPLKSAIEKVIKLARNP